MEVLYAIIGIAVIIGVCWMCFDYIPTKFQERGAGKVIFDSCRYYVYLKSSEECITISEQEIRNYNYKSDSKESAFQCAKKQ